MAAKQPKDDELNQPDQAAAAPAVTASVPVHCPYRQAALLQQALAPDKMRVAFFLGAGAPMAIRVPANGGTRPLIPDVDGLTTQVCQALEASDAFKEHFAVIGTRLKKAGNTKPNVEELLSHIRVLGDVAVGGSIDGLTPENLAALDGEICRLTTKTVSENLPGDDSPYHRLASWIGGIQRSNAVEVFTSNYDLLMEQAFEARKVPYFDGFVGSHRTFFDLGAMEHDKLPARWSRLWKIHGSINWWRSSAGDVERRPGANAGDRQMIYPSHLKYDQSRRLPYLAMLDRLKAFLANGQAVLVACGYSFSDQHLNEVILQGLGANPTAVCFGLIFGDRSTSPEGVSRARKQPNLSLLAADGAVLGSIERDWRPDEKSDHPLHGIAVKAGDMPGRSSAPTGRPKLLLGDFKALGDFLARQLSEGVVSVEPNDAK